MPKNDTSINNLLQPLFPGSDILTICETYDTPFYIYDKSFIKKKIEGLKHSLSQDFRLYYAVKANPNLHLLRAIRDWVDGVDISSGGELRQSLGAGFSPSDISYAGPGKTEREVELAIQNKIGILSIESLTELRRAEQIAARLNVQANVSLRINPVKVFKEFAIKMGGRSSQFGIDEEQSSAFFETLRESPHCTFVGIHVYSGTQCLNGDTLLDNFKNTLSITKEIVHKTGIKPAIVNFGGGFGVPYYENQSSFDAQYVCSALNKIFTAFKKEAGLAALAGIIELGRYLIADAGVYIAQVVDVKISRGKTFCILNGGMNHHLPASGNFGQVIRKNFKMVNLSNPNIKNPEEITVVGPLCTTIDILGDRIWMPKPAIGDYIAIRDSGAYAYTASPLLFLSHDPPLEIMVEENGETDVIRESVFE